MNIDYPGGTDFRIWSLVSGLPSRLRRQKIMVMLQAYIDDSSMNQAPLSVLAGWVAPAVQWAKFSDEWDKILRFGTHIEYFKYADAMNFNGQFHGISEASRDEKLIQLVRCLEEHNPLGVAALAPHDLFNQYFGKHDTGVLRHPYSLCFYQIILRLFRHYSTMEGPLPKVEFIFDDQPGQRQRVMEGWDDFVKAGAGSFSEMLGSPPSFKDDKDVMPLQAADLHAGWVRDLDKAYMLGQSVPVPIWKQRGKDIRRVFWQLTEDEARAIKLAGTTAQPARCGGGLCHSGCDVVLQSSSQPRWGQ